MARHWPSGSADSGVNVMSDRASTAPGTQMQDSSSLLAGCSRAAKFAPAIPPVPVRSAKVPQVHSVPYGSCERCSSMIAKSRSVRVGYSLGSFATGAFGTVPGLLLLPYLTDSLGVAAGLAGSLALLPKAWDVVFNPVAGRISDRTVTRIGPRRPYVLWGGIAAGILFMLIFAGVLGTSRGAPLWVVAAFVLCATAYAFFQVPYSAMPAEITDDKVERGRLLSWRVAVIAVVILICGAVAPAIANGADDRIVGYRAMGVFVGAFFLVGAIGTYVGTRRAPIGKVGQSEPTLRAQLRVAAVNRPFLALFVRFIIQGAGIATTLAGVNYFADQVMGLALASTLLFVAFIAPAIFFMPLWARVGRRIGTLRGFVAASLLFALGGLLLALVAFTGANSVLSCLATAVIGVGYAGEQVFALAMLAECIAADTARTGKAQGGVFAGLWTAGETLGYALGPAAFALFLQLPGYVSTTAGHAVTQPDSVRVGVILGFAVTPAVLMAAGLVLLRWYRPQDSEAYARSAAIRMM